MQQLHSRLILGMPTILENDHKKCLSTFLDLKVTLLFANIYTHTSTKFYLFGLFSYSMFEKTFLYFPSNLLLS